MLGLQLQPPAEDGILGFDGTSLGFRSLLLIPDTSFNTAVWSGFVRL